MTPEKIEGVYLSSNSLLTQLFVHGDFLQTYLVGIVGVDPVGIRSYIKTTFQKDISTNEEVIAFLNLLKIEESCYKISMEMLLVNFKGLKRYII